MKARLTCKEGDLHRRGLHGAQQGHFGDDAQSALPTNEQLFHVVSACKVQLLKSTKACIPDPVKSSDLQQVRNIHMVQVIH